MTANKPNSTLSKLPEDPNLVRQQEYDSWHENVYGDSDLSTIELSGWHRAAIQVAPEFVGKAVLEVGCGVGDFAVYLSQQGAEVTALDFSQKAVELAVKRAANQQQSIEVAQASAEALPFAADSFDLVFSCECLEHVPRPPIALGEMYRVLKPGGSLILTTENYTNGTIVYWILAWVRGIPFNSGNVAQPIEQFFTFWALRKMFRNAGFTEIDFTGWHYVFFALPKMHPQTFVKEHFSSAFWSRFFRPFARHVTFFAKKKIP